ncbi:leucine-rich repeat-containing protein 4-like isoform X1 [Conger conger]|uniref:leucine-rich repeat-containing protein 4-like isoform X1 n=1 Tax=Conger conger TaxID=82655 RepID=UPI002A5A12EB|nr:leucine-rich repeat-containing protein 4-like isoform X1 [Conger conger]
MCDLQGKTNKKGLLKTREVTVSRTWNAALLFVVYLMVRAWSLCAASSAASLPHSCPAVCSCSNQLGKVVCTRRGLTRVPLGIPPNARHLNLMENSIELIQADTFRNLQHLEVLQLGRNAIRQIEVGAFNGLSSLNTLELFDNRLTVIPSGAFEYLSKLRELWLRNNPVESIPFYAFNRVPSLMRLDLGELRKLEYISDGAFEGLHNLKYLNMRMCNLRELPTLGPLVALEELEVSENHFPVIRPRSFRGLRTLKKLWIMNSQVRLIERNAFDDLTALMELNLAHNNLSSLPHGLFATLRHLVELHLHHNPWSCDCEAVWLAGWVRERIASNSTCCGRCHTPAHMRGRYLVEVEPGGYRCSAPFISDAPRDLNISAEREVELRCRTSPMWSVRWLLPNGTILTHGSSHPRMVVLSDGTLTFSNVLPGDKGTYICMVANSAGSSNASAFLNVSGGELNTSNLSYFTTVTVETLSPTVKPGPATPPVNPKAPNSPAVTASPSVFQPAFISTPTVLLHSTLLPIPPSGSTPSPGPTAKGKQPDSIDEVMKTTKIIIGCFVAVTLLAAVMLIVFYKLRKRHQQRSTVGAARTIEIIQVDEDIPPPASAGAATSSIPGEGALLPPAVREHNSTFKSSYSTYTGSHTTPWAEYSLCNSLPRSRPREIITVPDTYSLKTTAKDRVQETQI